MSNSDATSDATDEAKGCILFAGIAFLVLLSVKACDIARDVKETRRTVDRVETELKNRK